MIPSWNWIRRIKSILIKRFLSFSRAKEHPLRRPSNLITFLLVQLYALQNGHHCNIYLAMINICNNHSTFVNHRNTHCIRWLGIETWLAVTHIRYIIRLSGQVARMMNTYTYTSRQTANNEQRLISRSIKTQQTRN